MPDARAAGIIVLFVVVLVICSAGKKRQETKSVPAVSAVSVSEVARHRASVKDRNRSWVGAWDRDVEMGLGQVTWPSRVHLARKESVRGGVGKVGGRMGVSSSERRAEGLVGHAGNDGGLEGRNGAGAEGVTGGVQLTLTLTGASEGLPAYVEGRGDEAGDVVPDVRPPPYAA